MSQEPLSMKKLREVLRLHYTCNLSNRKIAGALSLSASTVGSYLKAAKKANLEWAQLEEYDDPTLMRAIAPFCQQLSTSRARRCPIDFAAVHQQLKQKGVTRELLHEEYLKNNPSNKAISYSEFCRQYRAFNKTLTPSMRQTHVAGEKTFIDYAGPTVPIYNANTGEVEQAVIFVAVLGASNFTFAEATRTRSLPDWIGSHVRMFDYFGGVTELIIPDNEKAGVTKACYYEPDVNPNYTALAAHYKTAILPTRPYRPKDKAKVEVAVQIVERWILARLRHLKFFSLLELNQAIHRLLAILNDRPFKKLGGSRRTLFKSLDQPALKPLPEYPYEFKIIKKAQVNLSYHIEVERHHYSVPHTYIGQCVEYQLGEDHLAVFCRGERIAYHLRSRETGTSTTVKAHMPKTHQQHQQWTPDVFFNWGKTVGEHTLKIVAHLIGDKPHPECCYRIHLGFMSLAKKFGKTRLEEACQYAHAHQLVSYSQVKSILETQADKAPLMAANDAANESDQRHCLHSNVRGPQYYSTKKGENDHETSH